MSLLEAAAQPASAEGQPAQTPAETAPAEKPAETAPVADPPAVEFAQIDKALLPEKFRNAKDPVAALLKSYGEAEKLIHKKPVAPEKYDVKVPEGMEGIPDEILGLFREAGMQNEHVQAALNAYAKVLPGIQNTQVALQKERLARAWKVQTDDAFSKRLFVVKEWATKNLSEEQRDFFGQSAEGILHIESLMEAELHKAELPSVNGDGVNTSKVTKEQIDSWVRDERYWSDSAFRARVNRAVATNGQA